MFKMISIVIAIALSFYSCACILMPDCYPINKSKVIAIESSKDPLVLVRYKQLGIQVAFPADILKKEICNSRMWQDTFYCQTLRFVLARAPNAGGDRGDLEVLAGHINVYAPQQYQRWMVTPGENLEGGELIDKGGRWKWSKEDEKFDVLQTFDACDNSWGLMQETYRLDRKASDGRVLQAMITRMHYTEDQKIIDREIMTITNILNSVRFIQ